MPDQPAEVEVHTTVGDGLGVVLRPVVPDDSEALAQGMRELSPRSRYLRFFSGKGQLSDTAVRYLTEVDYVDHFAWVVLEGPHTGAAEDHGEESGMAIGRYIRPQPDADSAEIAVVVGDDYQGRGLGTLLVHALALVARDNGIPRLTATVLAENRAMQSVLRRLGMKLRFSPEDGALFGSVDLATLPVDDTDLARALLASAAAARSTRPSRKNDTASWPGSA